MNSYHTFFCIFFFITGVGNVSAQVDSTAVHQKKNYVQVQFGLVHTRLIDFGYAESNLLFRGTNSKFGLGYGRETGNYIFNLRFPGGAGNVESKSGHLPSDFFFVEPSVEYLRKIKRYRMAGKNNIWLAGVTVGSINYVMQNESIFDNIDIYSLHGAYLTLGNKLFFNQKKRLLITYSLPVAVYTNHVLWNGGASTLTYGDAAHLLKVLTTRGQFSYFDVFRNVQINATYQVKISRNADAELVYRFFYNASSVMAPVHLYSNELLLGLKRRF